MHPAIATGPLLGLAVGVGLGAALAVLIKRPVPNKIIRWFAIVCCSGSWMAYIGGVLNWRYNVEPHLDGTEGTGVGFGAIFVHLVLLIVALFLTGLTVSILGIQSRRSHVQSKPNQKAEQGMGLDAG